MKTKFTFLFFLSMIVLCHQVNSQIVTENLVGYWPFNGNANDESGIGNNGTIIGASLTSDRFGNPNSAYLFDGSDDKITCGTDNMSVTNQVSVSAWIKTTSGDVPTIFSKYYFSDDKGYNLRLQALGDAVMEGRDLSGGFISSGTNEVSLFDGQWHHLVGIVNNDLWTIYVDGNLANSFDTEHSSVALDNPGIISIGALSVPSSGNYRYFNGVIDDIAVYNRVLTNHEILQLYAENNCVIYDSIAVTDTLIIDVEISIDFPYVNTIKIYPNPARDFIIIDNGDFSLIENYSVKIETVTGEIVFESIITQPEYQININDFGAYGTYFVKIFNEEGTMVHTRKLILM